MDCIRRGLAAGRPVLSLYQTGNDDVQRSLFVRDKAYDISSTLGPHLKFLIEALSRTCKATPLVVADGVVPW
jgi:hypothetical protein